LNYQLYRDFNNSYHWLLSCLTGSQLNASVNTNNNLLQLTAKHKIILFSLNSSTYPQLAINMRKLLIQDLKEFASIKPKKQAINLVLDEFNVFADENIINPISKTRSFNF